MPEYYVPPGVGPPAFPPPLGAGVAVGCALPSPYFAAIGASAANGATAAPPCRTGGFFAAWGWVITILSCWGWSWFVKSAAASAWSNMTGFQLTRVFLFPVVPPPPARPRNEPNIWSGIISFYDHSPGLSLAMTILLTYRHWGFAMTHFWCPTK
jgi:hypothetical protein